MLHKFQVWSPFCQQINLVIGEGLKQQSFPMEKDKDDNWNYSTDIGNSCLYWFQIDGDKAFPDPCSHFQPLGIHGPSEVINHKNFTWTDQEFIPPPWQAAIIYELHVGTFTRKGRFVDIIENLAYLKDLGVTHIELMPVSAFSGNHGWGYDGVYPFAPHAAYGRPEELKTLVDACHQLGLAVIIDLVYNHFGPSGNYFTNFGPYQTGRYLTPWGEAINYDDEYSDGVRKMVLENVSMWLSDYHFDGLRLDAIHAIFDQSATHILEELAQHVRILDQKLNKNHFLIAESDLNDPKIIRSSEEWGFGFTGQWSDDYHHAIHSYLTKERDGYYIDFGKLSDIGKALQKGYIYDGNYSQSRKRKHGRPIGNANPRQLITCIQNHDQIGNRAKGDRLSDLLSLDSLKLAATLNILSPTTPMIFQGEEWGASSPFTYFTDHQDLALAKAVKKGRTEEFSKFGWNKSDIPDPGATLTFESSRLLWEEKDWEGHYELLAWYKKLIKIRKAHLDQGSSQFIQQNHLILSEEQQFLSFTQARVLAIFNFSDQAQSINQVLLNKNEIILATSRSGVESRDTGVFMPANCVAIFLEGSSR